VTAALNYAARRLAVSIVAFGCLALLSGGSLQTDRQAHAANTQRAATPAQYESTIIVTCYVAALANSADRSEPMSVCWRNLVQTAVLGVSACVAWLDAMQLADWRAARFLFNQVLYRRLD
jgi:hypothetical protein